MNKIWKYYVKYDFYIRDKILWNESVWDFIYIDYFMFCVGFKWDSWGGFWYVEDNFFFFDWELFESVFYGEYIASLESFVYFV